MSNVKIHVVQRKNEGAGAGMYRVYCEGCQGFTYGNGRTRYQSFWQSRRGAERAQQGHQDLHDRAAISLRSHIAEYQELAPNWYEVISSIPLVPLFTE